MSTTTVTLSQIGQISVTAHDIDRAVAFYRDTLGVPFLFRAGVLAFFNCGGIRLMISPPEKSEFDHPSSVLYFKVTDIHEAHAALGNRGGRFEDEPHLVARMPDHELWMTFFRDSEDNVMALMSEVRTS